LKSILTYEVLATKQEKKRVFFKKNKLKLFDTLWFVLNINYMP